MPIEDCENEVIAAGATSREEARAMLDAVDARAARIEKLFGKSAQDAVQQAAAELTAEEAMAAAIERRNKVLNLNKRIARRQILVDTAEAVGKPGAPDLADAVLNQLVSRNRPTLGSRFSAEAEWRSTSKQIGGALQVRIDKAGLMGMFRDPAMARDWGAELFELSRKAANDPEANPGKTGNTKAAELATIIHGVQQMAKERLNNEGAWIGDYAGWITSTQHDQAKISGAKFGAWRDYILPRLADRTFDGVADRDAFLQKTWEALVSGVHLVDRESVGMKEPAFTGPANMADRLSSARKLHFADANGWMDYQEKFGNGALNEQVVASLDRSARALALMRRFGTNPEADLLADVEWLKQRYSSTAPDRVAELGNAIPDIKLRMDYLTGAVNIPGNVRWANISAGIRTVESMAHLGGVMFTHLSALNTGAAEARYHGIGFFDRWAVGLQSIFERRGKGETRELSDLLLAGLEGMHGHMLGRFSADDAPAGTISKLANQFFRFSGLTALVDAEKAGRARMMSRLLGQNVDNEFGALPAQLQRTLKIYGIAPHEWEALRQADHFAIDGRKHVTIDAAGTMPDALVEAMRPERPKGAKPLSAETLAEIDSRTRDLLGTKLQTLFNDIADRSIITPSIDDRAMVTQGARAGTLPGEATRFMAQFKMWGIAAARQGIGREINGGQAIGERVSGMLQLAMGSIVMGYLTITLKDIFNGKEPRSIADPKTWMHAAIQGGGFGILADFLFGEFARTGHTLGETLLGPVGGTISDLGYLFALTRGVVTRDPHMHAKDIGPEALRIVKGNTPFINLFYVKRALDYLLFHSMQETMNPGYLRRAEQTMQKRSGQHYLGTPFNMSPTNHLHTFGR